MSTFIYIHSCHLLATVKFTVTCIHLYRHALRLMRIQHQRHCCYWCFSCLFYCCYYYSCCCFCGCCCCCSRKHNPCDSLLIVLVWADRVGGGQGLSQIDGWGGRCRGKHGNSFCLMFCSSELTGFFHLLA